MANGEFPPGESPPKDSPADPRRDDADAADTDADGEGASPDDEPTGTTLCDLCGGPMMEVHCKYVCVQCGYTRDCSDP